MARRKKTAKKTTRRRRVSGVGAVTKGIGQMVTNAALATAGYVGASMLAKMIPVENNLVKAGAKIAGGVVVGKFMKGNAGSAIALGMAISGVVDVAKNFAPGLISGIGEEPMLLISGTGEDISTLGDIDQLGEIESLGGQDELGGISTLGGI